MKHDYIYDTESGNRMIVSEVETIAAADGVIRSRHKQGKLEALDGNRVVNSDASINKQSRRFHLLLYDNLSNYSNVPLPPNASGEPKVIELCHGEEICCSLTYTSTSSLNYSFLVYSGNLVVGEGMYAMYIQTCSVVWCQTDDVNTCSHINNGLPPPDEFGSFTISGNFKGDHLFPVAFTRNFSLIDNDLYSVTVNGNNHTLSMPQESQNLMSAGLLTRLYDRDPSKVSTGTSSGNVFELVISFIARLLNFSS